MISFHPTDEEQAFYDLARNFAVEHIRPAARECEANRSVSASIMKMVGELGFLTLELPESWGGLELPLISQVQILQALSYGDLGIVQGLSGPGDAASFIRLQPDHPLLQSYKSSGRNGCWPSVAFIDVTDRDAPWASELDIRANGSGYIIKGTSQPVRLATSAEYVLIAAVDSEGESVVLWLENKHWEVLKGDFRLGLLAAGLGRLHFPDVHVGAEQVIARGKEASELIANVQQRLRVLEAAKEIGLMEASLNYAVEYTAGRQAFGQEIAKFQGVSFTIAEMAFEFKAAKHLVWQAAIKVDEQANDAEGHVLRALSRAHRSLRHVTDCAVQMLGGHGYVQEYPVEKWMRDAQAQVALYGRERDLLVRCGEQIMNRQKERVAQ
ncbi:acyl-CoA dehydrogenase domain-containing protein [Parageobacillus genomosp. 1]|uniref:Acyl-CoA dehydrogenase domain-containing protein n=1 Tax=Parageobacillus genomosp. 1 TaxID=1295642 RepID=A0ABC9VDT3_9BACL|nr:acyl-CoA dehydrogenase family protein [Parageobacillus genomosp. 1]EZP76486.1 acyl-CoA dehydrogenase domain-containing protein [Parageobacillus genomosp. 1]